jgi:hypothetical protein
MIFLDENFEKAIQGTRWCWDMQLDPISEAHLVQRKIILQGEWELDQWVKTWLGGSLLVFWEFIFYAN